MRLSTAMIAASKFYLFHMPYLLGLKDVLSTDNGKHAAWVVPFDLYTLWVKWTVSMYNPQCISAKKIVNVHVQQQGVFSLTNMKYC